MCTSGFQTPVEKGWIDVSVPLHSEMVRWPDVSPVAIERTLEMEHGDVANVSKISMGSHTGTHTDALSTLLGRAKA